MIMGEVPVGALASFFFNKQEDAKKDDPKVIYQGPRSQANHRQFADTASVKDKPTPINFRKVSIEVSDGLVKDGGIFTASYISYLVKT
jgi:hypothetical protein